MMKRTSPGTFILLAALLLMAGAASAWASGGLEIRFRKIDSSGFPLVVSSFDLRDRDGAAIRNLPPGCIEVAENYEKIDRVRVESQASASDVVFVIDNSLSMQKFNDEVTRDFFQIVELLDEGDRVGLIQLRGRPTVLQCLTNDRFSALEKIRYFKKFGAADLMGGLEKALSMLESRGGRRPGEIILLTDTPECGQRKLCKAQTRTFNTIGERLRVQGIRLHVIGFGDWASDDEMLAHLVHETGGQHLIHPNPWQLTHEFTGIINSAPAQYRISYISPQRLGREQPHHLMVRVRSERGSGERRIQFRP